MWEGAGGRTGTAIFWPLLLWQSALSFLFSWCSTGGPGGHSAGWWLSLLLLISDFSVPKLHLGSRGPLRMDAAFPTTSRLPSTPTGTATLTWLLSWLSCIIVQRPLNRLLDLWNGMIDRHPAEITVMQFTGHSLPVHQSMSVPWEFFYFVPFHQPISARAISSHNCHYNVSLPSGASPWNGIFGRVEGQNTTLYSMLVLHTSVSWWAFTGVWATATLFKSPGLFSVF